MACPACGSAQHDPVYEARHVPVHSVVLLHDRATALDYPTGDIRLEACQRCDLLFNSTFEPELLDYRTDYESTQACSEVFDTFQRDLAQRLVDRHGIRGRDVVDIGCGQGEFLTSLCAQGGNRGIGFDPAYRGDAGTLDDVQFRRVFFNANAGELDADLVCCKMTLEHIAEPGPFVRAIHAAIVPGRDTTVFFQVPNAQGILAEGAFWDVYYEHCSYFDADALTRLFQSNGFHVTDCWSEFDNQYLMLEAKVQGSPACETPSPTAASALGGFSRRCEQRIRVWREWFAQSRSRDERVVLWGGGPKAVALLCALGAEASIDCVVDINPRKHGTYLPATGHEVIAPRELIERSPDRVIVMNPIYLGEIVAQLDSLGLAPEVLSVARAP